MYARNIALFFIFAMSIIMVSNTDSSEFALLVSGEELGYLESTGCEDETGGLAKRATLLRSLQQQYPASLNIHVGNIIDLPDRNSELAYQIALEALSAMKYDVVCVGPKDLALSVDILQSFQANYPSMTFLLTNLNYHTPLAFAGYTIRDVQVDNKTLRIAFANLIWENYLTEIQNVDNNLTLQSPSDSLQSMRSMLEKDSDLQCAIIHGSTDEAKKLAQSEPWLDIAIVVDESESPVSIMADKTIVVENSSKGKSVGVLKLILDQQADIKSWDSRFISLTDEISPDPAIDKLVNVLPDEHDKLTAAVPAGSRAINLTYFYKRGCLKCRHTEDILERLKNSYAGLVIEPLNVKENFALLESMGHLYQIPDRKRLTTPVIFIGDSYFLKDNIDEGQLKAIINKYTITGVASRLAEAKEYESSAKSGILTRFGSMSSLTIAGAGLLDGINPCAFATLIFFISCLSIVRRKRKEMLITGIAFSFAVFMTYLLIGIGALQFLDFIGSIPYLSQGVYLLAALLTLILAVLSFYDAWLAKKGKIKEIKLQLSESMKSRIHKLIREKTRTSGIVAGALVIGFAVSSLELVCTGQVYLPTLTFVSGISAMRFQAFGYLLLYNIMFIVPLLIVFACAYWGVTALQMVSVLEKNLMGVKLGIGFLLVGLAFWLVSTILL